MSRVDRRLRDLGLSLPPALIAPDGAEMPFHSVRVVGDVAYVGGHGPQAADGRFARPLGALGKDLDVTQGYQAAHLTALSVLAGLRRTLGDLDRITAWGRVFGMVKSAPGFTRQLEVVNGFSDLVLEVFGDRVGAHARSVTGVVELPFGIPLEVEAQVHLAP